MPHDDVLEASAEVRETVGQMVQQFADPMAFLRELVQNALDADATEVSVRFDYAPEADTRGVLQVSVEDDGHGMDRETLERCLLVLFRSTKDRDPTKIGKFGVGFFSVFAPEPRRVLVDTCARGAPSGHRVTLLPSFSYELEGIPARVGTTVTLELSVPEPELDAWISRAGDALDRWCPHVGVPLHVRTRGLLTGDRARRVDVPFTLAGAATWHGVDETGARFAMATSAVSEARFYKRGLLLHRTSEALVPGVSWKVDDPALRHTVSRDDVRRDEAFARVLGRARAFAEGPLRDNVRRSFRRLAEACAERRQEGRVAAEATTLSLLAEVAVKPPFSLGGKDLPMPLTDPVGGALVRVLERGLLGPRECLCARERSGVTAALASRGVPVVDLGAAPGLLLLVQELQGAERLTVVQSRYTLLVPAPREELPGAPEALGLAMATLSRRPAVAFATFSGRDDARFYLGVKEPLGEAPRLVEYPPGPAPKLRADEALVLNARDAGVRHALALARTDPSLAAYVVLRLLALEEGTSDEDSEAALLGAVVLP
ncbi:MAG: ATP-binding protein [Deltaproteobacteria bacterium]|nr:ATP-binding protein [Deltaproteobacteria bacterium]